MKPPKPPTPIKPAAPFIAIPLEELRKWLMTQAHRERLNGDISLSSHTMSLRKRITASSKRATEAAKQQGAA